MSAKHTAELDRAMRGRLEYLAKQLINFVNIQATPKSIIANEILLIAKAGMVFCGREFFEAFWSWMVGKSRHDAGVCENCDKRLGKKAETGCCRECNDEVVKMMAQALDEDPGSPKKGGPGYEM